MKKIISTIVLLVVFTVAMPSTALACKPSPTLPKTQKEMMAQKDITFIGTVSSLTQDSGPTAQYIVGFKVDKGYKGVPVTVNTVTLTVASSSAACGYDNGHNAFALGSVWVINATGSLANGYMTNSLSLNTSYTSVDIAQKAMAVALGVAEGAEDPVMCTMQYAPVCGKKDTGIRCITTPCDSFETKTYGNACLLGADRAEFLYEGECRSEEPVVTINKPVVPFSGTTGEQTSIPSEVVPTETFIPVRTVTFWEKILIGLKSLIFFWK